MGVWKPWILLNRVQKQTWKMRKIRMCDGSAQVLPVKAKYQLNIIKIAALITTVIFKYHTAWQSQLRDNQGCQHQSWKQILPPGCWTRLGSQAAGRVQAWDSQGSWHHSCNHLPGAWNFMGDLVTPAPPNQLEPPPTSLLKIIRIRIRIFFFFNFKYGPIYAEGNANNNSLAFRK